MIISNIAAHSETLFKVSLDANDKSNSFLVPGQYVVMQLPEQKPLYLVIASTVGSKNWDFYIRDTGIVTQSLKSQLVGSDIDVSNAQGKGYPMQLLKNKNIILISAGTGIASFYSVIQEILNHRSDYGNILIYHGSRYENEILYREEMMSWLEKDIEIFLTLSQPSEEWPFYEGHVQNILNHETPELEDYVALICGPKQMMKDVGDHVLKFGLDKNAIYTNY